MADRNNQKLTVTVESRTIIRILLLSIVALMVIKFISNVADVLVLIFIAFFLALALNPAVSKISSMLKTKSRILATGVAYILVVVFLSAFIAFVVPPLVKQTSDFIKEVPSSIQDYKEGNSSARELIDKYNLEPQVDRFTADFSNRFGDVGKPILSTAGAIGSTVANTIIVLVLTFMMLVEGQVWLDRFWAAQNPAKRVHRKKLANRMYKVVTSYVNAQVIIAALAGLFASIAIFILSQIFDAPVNAIALGGIISLFALLPLIGTTLGAVVVVLACLLVSAPLAIAVAIFFVIYQQIENVTIQPYIQSRGNNLTPLIVFVAALIGVGFGGILGAFVAIPAAGCLKILLEDYFESHKSSITKAF